MPVAQSVISSVNDLDSTALNVGNLVSGVVIFESGRDSRVFVQAQYAKYEFPGTTLLIGELVKAYSISTIFQSKFRVSRNFKPYLGFGLGLKNEEHSNRYTTDTQGFLAQSFDDESIVNITVDANITDDIDLFKTIKTGWSLRYSQPVSDGLKTIEAGIYILF